MKKIIILIFIFTAIFSSQATAQSGMKYADFAKKLELYFHPDLISDISKEIGKTDFSVWGWDVGDFSDDGNNDIGFAIRRLGSKDKTMDVYLFVDIDGFLVKVGQFKYEFVELPLEVGVAIRYGVVYVTQKFKQFNWKIESFKFVNASLVNYEKYYTSRIGKMTHEITQNYYNLRNTEKYLQTANSKIEFWADYYTIPAYQRSRFIYKGISSEAYINQIEFCPEGAYWWTGDADLSFSVSSAYDDEFLYFTVNVIDDNVVKPYNNIANGEGIELWLDVNDYTSSKDRFASIVDEKITYKTSAQKKSKEPKDPVNNENDGIVKFSILTGDFINKEPTLILETSQNSQLQGKTLSNSIIADLADDGYYVIFKIPFSILKRQSPPQSDAIIEWGATLRVIDVDNEFRPERRTILQTSLFEIGNPSSFGSIAFVPNSQWYGSSNNFYNQKIIQSLEDIGF